MLRVNPGLPRHAEGLTVHDFIGRELHLALLAECVKRNPKRPFLPRHQIDADFRPSGRLLRFGTGVNPQQHVHRPGGTVLHFAGEHRMPGEVEISLLRKHRRADERFLPMLQFSQKREPPGFRHRHPCVGAGSGRLRFGAVAQPERRPAHQPRNTGKVASPHHSSTNGNPDNQKQSHSENPCQ